MNPPTLLAGYRACEVNLLDLNFSVGVTKLLSRLVVKMGDKENRG